MEPQKLSLPSEADINANTIASHTPPWKLSSIYYKPLPVAWNKPLDEAIIDNASQKSYCCHSKLTSMPIPLLVTSPLGSYPRCHSPSIYHGYHCRPKLPIMPCLQPSIPVPSKAIINATDTPCHSYHGGISHQSKH